MLGCEERRVRKEDDHAIRPVYIYLGMWIYDEVTEIKITTATSTTTMQFLGVCLVSKSVRSEYKKIYSDNLCEVDGRKHRPIETNRKKKLRFYADVYCVVSNESNDVEFAENEKKILDELTT